MMMNNDEMLIRVDLEELSKCGGESFTARVMQAFDHLHAPVAAFNEADFVQEMRTRFGMQSPILDFSAAGSFRYYASAKAVQAEDVPGDAKHNIEAALARLCDLGHAALSGEGELSLLVEVLKHLGQRFVDAPRRRVLLAASLHPATRQALAARLGFHAIDAPVMEFDVASGQISRTALDELNPHDYAAVVLGWPNGFGLFDDISALSGWAERADTPIVGLVNPHLLTWLKSPETRFPGALTALVGNSQSLGLAPLRRSNSPAFVASNDEQVVRSIARRTTSEPLAADMALLRVALDSRGLAQLRQGGLRGRNNLLELIDRLCQLDRVSLAFDAPFTNEAVIRVDGIDLEKGQAMLNGHNIVAGYALGEFYPELADCLLLHCNDRHQASDIERFVNRFGAMLRTLSTAPCPVKPKFT